MNKIIIFCLMITWIPLRVHAFNPADTIALAQILANAIQQLIKLKEIVETGKKNFEMLKEVNSGLDSVLGLIETVYPELDTTIYQDWKTVDEALKQIHSIYGAVKKSKDKGVLENLDRGIAEAIILHNKIREHTRKIDQFGDGIKQQSANASPKGAARLTAQGMGVLLQSQNESLRTQTTALKLQAQREAIENKKEKDSTNFFLESAQALSNAMKNSRAEFKTPRF